MKILLITFAFITSAWSNQLFPICDESKPRISPNGRVWTNTTDLTHLKKGYTIFTTSSVRVHFRCFAEFPVHLVLDNDMDSGEGVRETELYIHNSRFIHNYSDPSNSTYQSLMYLVYTTRVSMTQVISCQQISNPCHRRFITSKPSMQGGAASIFWKDELNIPEIENTTQGTEVETVSPKCDVQYLYGLRESKWNFCCKAPLNDSWGVAMSYTIKDPNSLENIERKSPFQPSYCAKEVDNLTDACNTNETLALNGLTSYAIKCALLTKPLLYHPIIRVMQSIDQELDHPSKLYFRWEDIPPEDMIRMNLSNPFREFKNNSVIAECLISISYFSNGGFLGVEDSEQGLITFRTDIMWEVLPQNYSESYHAYRVTQEIRITDTTKAIYCFAPVWNTTEVVNKSVQVIMLEPQPLKITNLKELEEVTWNVGDKNQSLNCTVTGKPIEKILWIFQNKTIQTEEFDNKNATFAYSVLYFTEVRKSDEGTYQCRVMNYAENVNGFSDLFIRDKQTTKIIAAVATTVGMLIILLLFTLGLVWRQNIKQRAALRLLTSKEINEFELGCRDDLQYALCVIQKPYDTQYEVERSRLLFDPETSLVLGKGAYGVVYKGDFVVSEPGCPTRTEPAAIKTVEPKTHVIYLKALLCELKVLVEIRADRHPNVIYLLGACTEGLRNREAFVALEYCAIGDLQSHLRSFEQEIQRADGNDVQNTTARIVEKKIQMMKWSYKIADGMNYLGTKNIIHADLASRNILLTSEFEPKIADFGLARIQAQTDPNYVGKTSRIRLPWRWMAIESLETRNFSIKSDVWSFGILLCEIFSLAQVPYSSCHLNWALRNESMLLQFLKMGRRDLQPKFASSEIYKIMEDCWKADPQNRPSFQTLHDLLKNISDTAGAELQEQFDDAIMYGAIYFNS